MAFVQIPETGFLRLSQVLAIIPVGKSSWWRGCKLGIYPQPVKLGPRTTAWKAEDIAALVERLGNKGGR
ncbi:MAG: AlpA family phage regulatory protein [Desulfovibrio sp.]|jgi:predicted DNA-binding transcriptional regulator AlpA|nr:AlpA family phage regulatory protein [Desulfovibrio sp.]